MRVDGASERGTLWRWRVPLTRPALVTVSTYNGPAGLERLPAPARSSLEPETRTLAAGPRDVPGPVKGQRAGGAFRIRRPQDELPILILYAIGRRRLLAGLTAGFSK